MDGGGVGGGYLFLIAVTFTGVFFSVSISGIFSGVVLLHN